MNVVELFPIFANHPKSQFMHNCVICNGHTDTYVEYPIPRNETNK